MLIEKEVIGVGTVWSNDLKTGKPCKAVVTSEHLQHWHDQGNKMLALGLTVPVPCEHDFQAHPMTPADKLRNNAGWVKEYKLKNNRLYSILDIQDEKIAEKLPKTIRWTSPWFSSFVDGQNREWKNVISHMALTTRPRVTDQAPFPSIAAAIEAAEDMALSNEDYTLCGAGLLKVVDEKLLPEYPVVFSLLSGVALSEEDMKKVEKEDKNLLLDIAPEDMKMEKLLCDLLCILGVPMPQDVSQADFKRTLYQAAMLKIKELSAVKPLPAPPPVPGKKSAPNPIMQESQPMYMSLEDINKIPDETMRNIALSMYNDNVKLRAELEKSNKVTTSLHDAKLEEERVKRKMRSDRLSRMSPRVKADLDVMLSLPSMALSLGDNGVVIDPMASTLSVLEKGLADIPSLLLSETPTEQPHPTDDELSKEAADALADTMARQMGCPPEQKKG